MLKKLRKFFFLDESNETNFSSQPETLLGSILMDALSAIPTFPRNLQWISPSGRCFQLDPVTSNPRPYARRLYTTKGSARRYIMIIPRARRKDCVQSMRDFPLLGKYWPYQIRFCREYEYTPAQPTLFLGITSETEMIQVFKALKGLVMNRCSSFSSNYLRLAPSPLFKLYSGILKDKSLHLL